jgi:hypothetical protein
LKARVTAAVEAGSGGLKAMVKRILKEDAPASRAEGRVKARTAAGEAEEALELLLGEEEEEEQMLWGEEEEEGEEEVEERAHNNPGWLGRREEE